MGVQDAVNEIHKLRPKALHNPIDLITLSLFKPAFDKKRSSKMFKASSYHFETDGKSGESSCDATVVENHSHSFCLPSVVDPDGIFEDFVSATPSIPVEQASNYAGDPDHQNAYNDFLISLENNQLDYQL